MQGGFELSSEDRVMGPLLFTYLCFSSLNVTFGSCLGLHEGGHEVAAPSTVWSFRHDGGGGGFVVVDTFLQQFLFCELRGAKLLIALP